MKRIHRLDESLANQIAAGEVVERPSAALKELLENSFDAGATEITVNLRDGGSSLLEVQDNGHGIDKEDVLLALERHATSKIQNTDDLFSIQTWGFRGEALASIAAISRLTLQSRTAADSTATELIAEGGKVLSQGAIARTKGTTVRVENLFYNTPARKNFLKSKGAETSACLQTLHRLAATDPKIRLEINIDEERSILYAPSESYEQRICALFEQAWKTRIRPEDLLKVEKTRGELKLTAWILPSEHFIPSTRGILTFVNRRSVKDKLIQQAILAAAKEVLFGHLYPQLVLFLEMPPEWVDVNVHPTKAEVRFRDTGFLFSTIKKSVEEALASRQKSTPFLPQEELPAFPRQEMLLSAGVQFHQKAAAPASEPPASFYSSPCSAPEITETSRQSLGAPTTNPRIQFLGTLKNTYLVCQDADSMLLIDQHAAHERVTYEKLRRSQLQKHAGSPLLIPIQVEVAREQIDRLEKVFPLLEKFGLSLDRSGPELVTVREVPALLIRKDGAPVIPLGNLVREIVGFEEIVDETQIGLRLQNKILDVVASQSCHGSVRAGQSLSSWEAEALLAQMDETDFAGHCPHGRPTSVRLRWTEIERLFKRIQ